MKFKTEQEKFWAGEFGNNYIHRNKDEQSVVANVVLFSQILKLIPDVKSIAELGCNIGLNLQALKQINPKFSLCGYEINKMAAEKASNLNIAKIFNKTIVEKLSSKTRFDITLSKGVLIHINPEELQSVYDNLYRLSKKYIVICEYYNPTPVVVNYRGNDDKLFKRDFAGDMLDRYNLDLVDYGFVYRRDAYFPQDDLTWFLLKKKD